MLNSTTNTYTLKREILTFSRKITKSLSKQLGQDYVIQLTAKRKLLYHNKWIPATQLRDRRKGKVKIPLFYKGKAYDAYLSHVKVQITASRKDIYLVLVYGILCT